MIEYLNISEIKPNPTNPRTITQLKMDKLVKSIKEFPEMLKLRPIVIDENNVVLGGNMRLQALKTAGVIDVPTIKVDSLTEEQKKEFIIKDNLGYGEWDWDILDVEFNMFDLMEWGMDIPDGFDDDKDVVVEAHKKLQDRFVIPPFSVLDTRQGYWGERKGYWKSLIKDYGESRENLLDEGGLVSQLNNGVSILDPVLAEVTNMWFGIPGGKTFDCFAGDSVFGYVSSYMGNTFTGVELREEQAQLNNERVKGFNANYICDDGRNILNHIQEDTQDLLFSCPPYFDLEVYSDLENDASNQESYEDFINILDTAFTNAIKCLKDNRFAVITVGDIRDKEGYYYGFVDDIKKIFINNGMRIYNELILVEPLGTLPQRVGKYMVNRKIGKCHQNVLVFYKGDVSKIKELYPQIDYESTDL